MELAHHMWEGGASNRAEILAFSFAPRPLEKETSQLQADQLILQFPRRAEPGLEKSHSFFHLRHMQTVSWVIRDCENVLHDTNRTRHLSAGRSDVQLQNVRETMNLLWKSFWIRFYFREQFSTV